MSESLGKRGRGPEALLDTIDFGEPKRFHREETDRFLQLLQLEKTLSDDDEEECAPSEDLVKGVMRSLEEEIAATGSTSSQTSSSGDKLAAADISSGHEGETRHSDLRIDLFYLMDASDNELGIPRSPVLDLKGAEDGFLESTDLKSLDENWQFEEEFENHEQFANFSVYEDAWDASQLQDYMNRDVSSQGMLFDVDFSTAGRLETACGL